MTGPQHYAEAQRLLDGPPDIPRSREEFEVYRRDNLAAAQVHATLALVAATIDAAETMKPGSRVRVESWREVTS